MDILPACFIPWESMESPAAAKTVTPARTRYLRKVKTRSQFGRKSTADFKSQSQTAEICTSRIVNPGSVRHPHGAHRCRRSGLGVFLYQLVARRTQLPEAL